MLSNLSLLVGLLHQKMPKITVIYDNHKENDKLKEGFGFSCLLEWRGRKILFDTGGDRSIFFDNARKLRIPIEQLSCVVCSHDHWDHTAGINQVLERIPQQTKVYLPDFFTNSLKKELLNRVQVEKVDHCKKIDKDIYLLVLQGAYRLGPILEQAMLLKTPKGVVIITGCAHPGILKIIREAQKLFGKVHMVIGGFHLRHDDNATTAKVVKQFREHKVEKVASCHCTGDAAIAQFKEEFGKDFITVGAGTVIKV